MPSGIVYRIGVCRSTRCLEVDVWTDFEVKVIYLEDTLCVYEASAFIFG